MNILGLIVVASILLFLFIKKLLELQLCKKLSEHVSWCMNNANRFELFHHTVDDLVPSAYRLNPNDESFVDTILCAYKDDLSSLFFSNRLSTSKTFVVLQSREYFFLTLNSFLNAHECDQFFYGTKLYDTIETEYYDGDGTKKLCRLTSAGHTYLKTLHLVSTYCICNNAINSNRVTIDSINYLKESIESGATTIFTYRP